MARIVGDSPAFIPFDFAQGLSLPNGRVICAICSQEFCGLKIVANVIDPDQYQTTAALPRPTAASSWSQRSPHKTAGRFCLSPHELKAGAGTPQRWRSAKCKNESERGKCGLLK